MLRISFPSTILVGPFGCGRKACVAFSAHYLGVDLVSVDGINPDVISAADPDPVAEAVEKCYRMAVKGKAVMLHVSLKESVEVCSTRLTCNHMLNDFHTEI